MQNDKCYSPKSTTLKYSRWWRHKDWSIRQVLRHYPLFDCWWRHKD